MYFVDVVYYEVIFKNLKLNMCYVYRVWGGLGKWFEWYMMKMVGFFFFLIIWFLYFLDV